MNPQNTPSQTPKTPGHPLWQACASIGLLGLIVWITLWNGWLSSTQQIPRSIELLILLTPLLWLVRGILHNRIQTYVHATLVALLYSCLGVWFAFTPDEQWYGYLVIILSILLYLGGFMNARAAKKSAANHPE